MTTETTVKAITVLGRRWFDKVNGNTYHTSQIMIDGKTVHITPYQYGYGNQYEQTAAMWLNENGYVELEKYPHGSYESVWRYCEKHGIHYEASYVDLPKKKDLTSISLTTS